MLKYRKTGLVINSCWNKTGTTRFTTHVYCGHVYVYIYIYIYIYIYTYTHTCTHSYSHAIIQNVTKEHFCAYPESIYI